MIEKRSRFVCQKRRGAKAICIFGTTRTVGTGRSSALVFNTCAKWRCVLKLIVSVLNTLSVCLLSAVSINNDG